MRDLGGWKVLFPIGLLGLVVAGWAVQPVIDPDTWWHLRVGEYIVDKSSLPQTDFISRVGYEESKPWLAYSWLYEIGLALAFDGLGLYGIMLLRLLAVLAVTAVVVRLFFTHAESAAIPLAVTALWVFGFLPFCTERPWHASVLLCAATLHVLGRMTQGVSATSFLWLPPMFALAANLHIQFVMSLGLLGIGCVCALVVRSIDFRGVVLMTLACFGFTLINPYFYDIYAVVYDYASHKVPAQIIQELRPPDIAQWWNWPWIALSAFAAYRLWVRGMPLLDTLVFAAGLVFAIRSQRDTWFGMMTAGFVAVRPAFLRRHTAHQTDLEIDISEGRVRPVRPALALLPAFGLVSVISALLLPPVSLDEQGRYPVAAARFAQAKKLSGPLYNPLDWGGWLSWNLIGLPVSIDGRTNFYGDERLALSTRVWNGEEEPERDPEFRSASLVIAPSQVASGPVVTSAALGDALAKRSDWELVYGDEIARVFVRKKKPGAAGR